MQDNPDTAAPAHARNPGNPVFLTGSILRHVLTMTSTGAIGLVAIFAAELIDVLFLSLLGDVEILAAVGYAGPIVFMTVATAIGISIATVSLVAPALGARDIARARRISASIHVFTFAVSTVLSLAFLPLLPWLLSVMGAKGRTADLALQYLLILVPTLPPLALAMTSSAVLRSAGDARRAMHVTLGAAIVAVILDPILIFGLGLGLTGAALATAIARVVIMVIGFHAVWRVHGLIERPTVANCRADLGTVLRIALPAMATNVATPVASAIVTAAFAPFGDAAVAGWAVIGRIQPVAFGFVFAMSGSVGPIIGQNLGAGQHQRMRDAFTTALQVVVLYTALAWVVLALASPLIVHVFKATGDTASLINLYCIWLAPIFGFQGALFVANAVCNTLGRPRIATVLNWARAILGTLPFTMAGAALAGAPGVLIGNLVGGAPFAVAAIWIAYQLIDQASAARPGTGSREAARLERDDITTVQSPWISAPRQLVATWFSSIVRAARQLVAARTERHTSVSGQQATTELKSWVKQAMRRGRLWAIGLPRPWKRLILATNDFVLLSFAVWLAMSLRYSTLFVPPHFGGLLLMLAAPAIGVAAFSWFGLYRLVTRFITVRGSTRLLICIGLSILFWALLALLFGASWIPRSVILVLYPLIGGGLIFASRQIFASALRTVGVSLVPADREPRPVVIYGAARTGVQLLDALHNSGDARVVGFLDENASLWGQYAGGVKIYRPDKLDRLIERENVKEVILALPEAQRRERQLILKKLQKFPVRVKTMPAIEDFAAGRATVSDLRPVDVEDLLGRDPVPANPELLARGIRGKAVMVTGAGGSIGSELVRQIIRQSPAKLVLYDLSEVALYEVELEARELVVADAIADAPRPQIVVVLGSVLDQITLRRTINHHRIATIYHAAAYKHVPIVETNPVAGLSNNTFGTGILAEAARELGVERLVLISTDKAVRPTNVMGASKRLSELILQAHASDPKCKTVFTMVRFGNVLDSSGSVVRRFRKQIQDGGPVTVTHPEIVRYFMSIPEAASLVLQAGAMASGGEVFVLDMGEPVKIDELARSMIRLMGLEVRDTATPDGDIQIDYVGLRPGEKLYEELLIGENTTPTEHALIRRSNEPHLPAEKLDRELAILKSAMDEASVAEIQAVLLRTVEGYNPFGGGDGEKGTMAGSPVRSRTLH